MQHESNVSLQANATKVCKDVLQTVLTNAHMAKLSTQKVCKHTTDLQLKHLLKLQAERYGEIFHQAQKMAVQQGVTVKVKNKVQTAFVSMMIGIKCKANKKTSHLASMMIQGTTMGVIELTKLLHHSPYAATEALCLAQELLDYQEDKIASLKCYL